MAVPRSIISSLSDSALSALATFSAGAFAVRHLPDSGVALFSLCLTSWIIGAGFPRSLVMIPLEVNVNRSSQGALPALKSTLAASRSSLIVAATVAAAGGFPAFSVSPLVEFVLMTSTVAAAAVGTAVLTHLRAAMHIAGRHDQAAITTFLSTSVTIGTLVVGHFLPRGPWDYALPFGALAAGQLSGIPSWRRAKRHCMVIEPGPLPPLRERVFMLSQGVVSQLSIYLQTAMIVYVLGVAESAHLEGARVAASPVYLVANGLSWILFPGLVRAIGSGATEGVVFKLVQRMGVLIATGLTYSVALLIAGDYLSRVFGRTIDGLLAATRAAGFAAEGAANAELALFIAVDQYRQPAVLSAVGAGLSLAVTFALLTTWGAFAVPAGQAASAIFQAVTGVVLISGHLRRIRR